jgi:hypothetical protein
MPKFGNSHGNISEMKDLVYLSLQFLIILENIDYYKNL